MKNLKAKAVMAKNKLGEMPTKAKVAGIVLIAAGAASLEPLCQWHQVSRRSRVHWVRESV